MRRNMDLIRTILTTTADADQPIDAHTFVTDTTPFELVTYHIELIEQAGLATTTIIRHASGIARASIGPLTWEGNDFLDTVRSDTLWANVKQKIATSIGTTSFEVIKQVATRIALETIL